MLQWDDVRVFLAVRRGGSLSAAARSLKINQTTVGRRLRALETAAGARLFDRLPDGFHPTPAGESLTRRAERVEEEMNGASLELGGREARLEGTVRLTAPG